MLAIVTKIGDVPIEASGHQGVLYHPEHKRIYASDMAMVAWQDITGGELGDEPLLLPAEAVRDAYRYGQPITDCLFDDTVAVGRRFYKLLRDPEEHVCYAGAVLDGVVANDTPWDLAVSVAPKQLELARKALRPRYSVNDDVMRLYLAPAGCGPYLNRKAMLIEMADEDGGVMIFSAHDERLDEIAEAANMLAAMGASVRHG